MRQRQVPAPTAAAAAAGGAEHILDSSPIAVDGDGDGDGDGETRGATEEEEEVVDEDQTADGGRRVSITTSRFVSVFRRGNTASKQAWRAGVPSHDEPGTGGGVGGGASVEMQGYLMKMGGARGLSRAWHERYCVLRDGVLEYFLSHEGVVAGGGGVDDDLCSMRGDGGGDERSAPPPKSKVPFPLAGASIVSPARRNALALGKHASLSFEVKPPRGAWSNRSFSAPSTAAPAVAGRCMRPRMAAAAAHSSHRCPCAAAPVRRRRASRRRTRWQALAVMSTKTEVGSGGAVPTQREEADAAIAEEAALLAEVLEALEQNDGAGADAAGAERAAVLLARWPAPRPTGRRRPAPEARSSCSAFQPRRVPSEA